ncbi:MAG: 50S ribosomal protein L18 [Candidatus Sumerlaeaceae bacterium]
MIAATSKEKREKRRLRIRKKIVGTAERPRLSVFKSLKHLYVQVTDDATGRTLAAATTNTKANKAGGKKSFANVSNAQALGRTVADKAKASGIESIVFDRSGYPYHGIVKAVAEAAREAGLKF